MSVSYAGRSPLGRPVKPSRKRFTHRLPSAVVPTFIGAAAVACLSAQALAGAPAMAATAHGTAAVSPTYQPVQHAQLLAATEKAAKERQQSGLLADYTVRSGDTLSAIANRLLPRVGRVAGDLLGQQAPDPVGEHHPDRAASEHPGRARPDPQRAVGDRAPGCARSRPGAAGQLGARPGPRCAGPCCAGPCCAGPCCAGPCCAGPCCAGPCRAGCAGCHQLGRQLVPAVRDLPRVGR